MVNSQLEVRSVLTIDSSHLDPRAVHALLDELVVLIGWVSEGSAPRLVDIAEPSLVLGFLPRRAGDGIDTFLDALGKTLDARNSGLDLEDRLRLVVTVDVGPGRARASALPGRVLAATPSASLVIEATQRWYACTGAPDPYYRAVAAGQGMLWLRMPGQSTMPGLEPADLWSPANASGGWSKPRAGRQAAHRRPPGGAAHRARRRLPQRRRPRDDAEREARPDLNRLTGTTVGLDVVVARLVGRAEAEGWTCRLVTAAFLGNPGNSVLRALVSTGFCDEAYAAIATIEDPDRDRHRTAVTSHRVVAEVADGRTALSELRCVFDHSVDDEPVRRRVAFGPARDWLLDSSPVAERGVDEALDGGKG